MCSLIINEEYTRVVQARFTLIDVLPTIYAQVSTAVGSIIKLFSLLYRYKFNHVLLKRDIIYTYTI